MRFAKINGFELHQTTSGGKAGVGNNRTSTIQVRCNGFLKKQFRFTVADSNSKKAAYDKAVKFCITNTAKE